ncbi:MMPL family transporter [Streptomyces sp. NPDC101455]|uniref:MMPL family transporter n=1 Tax=Streptomyces sp. NPDC101455 TaxID=3366142 RepID=UPI0037F1F521
MTRLARWCFGHRRLVLAAWLLILAVALGAARAAGSSFDNDLSLPGTDSQAAVSLLSAHFPKAAGESDQIVFRTRGAANIATPQVKTVVTAALAKVAALPHIASVAAPYTAPDADQISHDGTVAFARVTWDLQPTRITTAEARHVIQVARSADSPSVHVSLGGASITNTERAKPGPSIVVGVVAALLILLVVFGGAILPTLLPLLAAAFALIAGSSAISLLSHVLTVAGASTDLAVLIGLGVGVDYGLFMVSRHRSAVRAGSTYEDAAAEAANTSGRTVLFAGMTVCVALLGQFALGVSFLDGISTAAAVTVALTVATSLTLLPAMLGFLGPKVLSRRERTAIAAQREQNEQDETPLNGTIIEGGGVPKPRTKRRQQAARWAQFVENHRLITALGSLAAVLLIALPVFGLRLGSSDSSTDPRSWTTRQSYDALAHGFGPGFNGPLQLAAQVNGPDDLSAFDRLLATATHTPGVAAITPAAASPDGHAVIATIYPATSPQDDATVALVNNLRSTLIPQTEHGTGLHVHIGGRTASAIDFANTLGGKLPLFVAVVVILAFILLMAVFRSILIPLLASLLNLVSVLAALGAITAVFTRGWGGGLIGLAGTGPVEAFLPVVMFSVLFGLSMDYEVYTVSRMHEEWRLLTQENAAEPGEDPDYGRRRAVWLNHRAVTLGQQHSTQIIAAAAGIMVLVFGSFLIGGHHLLQEFGFGLGFSVFIDALLLRSLLLPAVMHLIGPANWRLPTTLAGILPHLEIETAPVPAHGSHTGTGTNTGTRNSNDGDRTPSQ